MPCPAPRLRVPGTAPDEKYIRWTPEHPESTKSIRGMTGLRQLNEVIKHQWRSHPQRAFYKEEPETDLAGPFQPLSSVVCCWKCRCCIHDVNLAEMGAENYWRFRPRESAFSCLPLRVAF